MKLFWKKNTKQLWKKGMIFALITCLLTLWGCGSNGDDNEDMPMGRYVETILEYPEGVNVLGQLSGDEGGLDLYAIEEGKLVVYETKDGVSWEKGSASWELGNGSPIGIARDSSGHVYMLAMSMEGISTSAVGSETSSAGSNTLESGNSAPSGPVMIRSGSAPGAQIYRLIEGQEPEVIDVQWNAGSMEQFGIMPTTLHFLENGDMVVGQTGAGVFQYGSDGSYKRTYGSGDAIEFTVSGDEIYICDIQTNAILVYDGNTYDMIRSLSFDSFTSQTFIAAGQDDAMYLYNANGVFRLTSGGTMLEKIIDGALTSLSLPDSSFGDFAETRDGSFFVYSGNMQDRKLIRYTYDPNVAARPEKELVVFTLYENATLRQAAGIFHRLYPEARINIQVGMGEDGATQADLIRTLNTEILGGKGPDIILLDQMKTQAYIDKDALMDITDLVKEISDREPLLETVAHTFEKQGKIYALPAKFSLPLLFVDEEVKEDMQDLSSVAAFAAAHPQIGLIGEKTAENLLRQLMPASAPGWYDGSKLDQDALAEFLKEIKTIADTPAPVLTPPESVQQRSLRIGRSAGSGGEIGENQEDMFNWAFEKTHAYIQTLTGFHSLMGPSMAANQRGETVALPLPGTASHVYIPTAILAINGQTSSGETAKDFLRVMLSTDVQSASLNDGFAVNLTALENSIEAIDNVYATMRREGAEGYTLSGGYPTVEEQNIIKELCLSIETPYLADSTLEEMIKEEAEGYFNGEKTLEQTIADIEERTRIYLAE